MQIIEFLSAAAVVLLLTRSRNLRAVFAAAAISSASAGFWMVMLPAVFPALELRDTRVASMNVPLAISVPYGMVVMLGLTIVPNLIALGAVRHFLWARPAATATPWTTHGRWALAIPVGIVYGEVGLIITVAMWSVLFALVLRSAYPLNVLLFYPRYPLLHVTAALGGIAAIGLQMAFDRAEPAVTTAVQGITKR